MVAVIANIDKVHIRSPDGYGCNKGFALSVVKELVSKSPCGAIKGAYGVGIPMRSTVMVKFKRDLNLDDSPSKTPFRNQKNNSKSRKFMAALSFYLLFTWIFLLSLFRARFAEGLCHADERSALLEFKRSFRTDVKDSRCVNPKVHSWSLDGSRDCCSWDGVQCDEVTGRVIALDLSSSCLTGTMSPNTTLFRLVHLESLDLASNGFNFSSIPYGFGNLSRLKHLNLSHSDFSGGIPDDISQLSELVSLDLSTSLLETLHLANMGNLVHNLTGLKELDLSGVSLLSPIPPVLANFSSLRSLRLRYCGLNGDFPVSIFQLPNLEVLRISGNPNLSGFFPKLHWGAPLKSLIALSCHFSGSLPSSMGNLSHLTSLDLSGNNISGQIPASFANLTRLSILKLDNNNLSGDTLEWVVNLTQLTELHISGNRFSSGFPSSFENLKQLTWLSLSYNDFHGDIPGTLWNLKDLEHLSLESLNLNGVLEVNDLLKLENLRSLRLSFNNISFTKSLVNATTSKLAYLFLNSCNLTEFPQFIGYSSELEWLDLSYNRIRGTIPRRMWNNSKESLLYIDLSHNLLTGFENNQTDLPLPNLAYLDVSSNLLEATLPVPPPSVRLYNISNNFLYGEVPTSICEVSSLVMVDLSNSALSGIVPPCLGSIAPLIYLNLARNKFSGMIPHIYLDGCALKMIDLRENRLGGTVPRSLGNCGMLEYLNLGGNEIDDTFPIWLSELAYLKVIGLQSNKFHGPIEGHLSQLNFTSLQILDLSKNRFNGKLPSKLLQSCRAMKVIIGQDKLAYMNIHQSFILSVVPIDRSTTFAMTMMNKGTETEYLKIPGNLVAIDLSSNKFEGFIPELIGDLKSLHMLNLSNNFLTGSIPPSLANLTVLESLDLSLNNLAGEIPQQLASLTFLEVFDVSQNRLSGPIPHGSQFNTFESSSFVMNKGLCGSPLPNKCTNGDNAPPPPSSFDIDTKEESRFDLDWKIVLTGAGVGFSVGAVLGNLIIDEKSRWFLHYSKRMARECQKVRKALSKKKICS
ncbi:receptor-like protein 7 [Rhodamnia argentea]|uniref:Receptor-like protein 7 n=1 Tax=Rhodamnia argentea TaxID=178133 RepID=A0A8B8MWX6_9MYRT|nr:receptor-like protein 7 [Rhodamnia argentea]